MRPKWTGCFLPLAVLIAGLSSIGPPVRAAPADVPWLHEPLPPPGTDLAVPAPDRVPLRFRAEERSASVALADYSFASGGLVDALVVDGEPLLSAPAVLALEANGARFVPEGETLETVSVDDHALVLGTRTRLDGLAVDLRLNLESDGFLLVTLVIAPLDKAIGRIDSLVLTLPLAKGAGRVLNRYATYDRLKERFDRATVFTNVETVDSPVRHAFSPVVSLESEQYGIEWMAETDAHHSLADEGDALVAAPSERGGIDLKFTFVNESMTFEDPIAYQFSLFPIPGRPGSQRRADDIIVSSIDAGTFVKRYGKYEHLRPIYFAHWSRVPFSRIGQPLLSARREDRVVVERTRAALEDAGRGYMPYGSMHLMDARTEELRRYVHDWAAAPERDGAWADRAGRPVGMRGVAFDDATLGEFMIGTHMEALDDPLVVALYQDVAGMDRLGITRQRAVREKGLPEEALYFPFFGLRQYVAAYRARIKARRADVRIVFHTSSIVPKAIATHADAVVVGETFHFLFRAEEDSGPTTGYKPDYFAVPRVLLDGPLRQKNGFEYVLLPQLVRTRNRIRPPAEILSRQTRSLLAFAFLNDYSVWGTKLSGLEYRTYLDALERFGGLDGSTLVRRTVDAPGGGRLEIGVRRRGTRELMLLYNAGPIALEPQMLDGDSALARAFGLALGGTRGTGALPPGDYRFVVDGSAAGGEKGRGQRRR